MSKPLKKTQTENALIYKLVTVGDSQVGKTSLIKLYTSGEPPIHTQATMGCEFTIKNENVNGQIVKLLVWDTAGQEKYRSMTRTFFNGCQGVVIVYSITDRKSFDNVKRWIDDIVNCCEFFAMVLVANKSDLVQQRVVSFEEGSKLASEYAIPFFETCIFNDKRPINSVMINDVFLELTRNLIKKEKEGKMKAKPEGDALKVEDNKVEKTGGCKC